MPIDALAPLPSLPRLQPLSALGPQQGPEPKAGATGFGSLLNNMLEGNRHANEAANSAIRDLATGEVQDLHTVALAVTQADLSFRLILEMRNRLSDALQEITRMQI
jgi:flagellar hook-basal body complex protein FliE